MPDLRLQAHQAEKLSLAALNNRDFVVWAGHFVSLLSVIGGWGGILPPHFGQKKSRRPFFRFPAPSNYILYIFVNPKSIIIHA